jgi:hypothetical protein
MKAEFFGCFSLLAFLLIACVPSQTNSPSPVFTEADVWVLEGINPANKQVFTFDLTIRKVLADYPYDSGIAYARGNSYTAEIDFSTRESDNTTFVSMEPDSSSDPKIICSLKQTDKFVRRYFGSSFFGSDLAELNKARQKNDSSKLGLCSLSPKK